MIKFNVTNAPPINFSAGARQGPAGGAGGGGSLTVREVDGTPSGTVTTLTFPNGTVAIAGNEATINPWAPIYAQTTDPGIAGQPWNDNGLLRFSTGYSPSLDFSIAANSMYIALLIEEF